MMRFLNLGCGARYHPDWVNVDFTVTSAGVIAHDLGKGIPFANDTFDVIYHSHLLEHFTKEQAHFFTSECFRVLRPWGILRVVVPDLEQICKVYLEALEKAEQGDKDWQCNYEWIMLELYDQCVRNQSGGEMINYLLRESIPNEQFIAQRFGSFYNVLMEGIRPLRENNVIQNNNQAVDLSAEQIGEFRKSGEIHQWMYDRYSLRNLLKKAGFNGIILRTATDSYLPEWRQYNLDTESDGTQYKADSLYMEAIKNL